MPEKLMNEIQLDEDTCCPKCGEKVRLVARAKFSPEVMTVVYKLQPGRAMLVEDFCKSLLALAKSLKIVGRELGTKAMVTLYALHVKDGEVSASVQVSEVARGDKCQSS